MADEAISLRPITAADLPFLYEVYAATRQEELLVTGWSEEFKAQFLHQQFDAQHRFYQENFADAAFNIVLRGVEPIGRLYVQRTAEEICVIDIALLPPHRGRGIGSGLLGPILREADASDRPVRLHAEQNNPVLRLYARLGFRQIGEHGPYFHLERLARTRATPPGGRQLS